MYLNRILENVVLPFGDLVLGTSFIGSLNQLRAQDGLDEEQLMALQEKRLGEILTYASSHSAYYRSCAPDRIGNPVERLKQFPLLTKTVLREKSSALLTRPIAGLLKKSSSGSTGQQSSVYMTKHELSLQRAMLARWWEWSGYRIGDSMLQTGMNSKRGFVKATKDFLFRIRYLSAFSYQREEIVQLLRMLSGRTGQRIGGYASSLFVLASIAEEENISGVHFDAAISWGDKLFPHYRRTIEQTFRTRVFDTYGCSEGLMIAAQKDLDYLYIMTPNVYLEILDADGREVPDGEIGQVVATSLTARSMPLIRYRLGDLAAKLPRSAYPRDRVYGYPLLKGMIGRDTDLVKTRSGKFMVVHSFTGIFEHIPEIRQFRVIQKNLDSVDIEYIPGQNFAESLLSSVKEKIQTGLGERFPVNFIRVEHIPPTDSGKPQIISSLIKDD